MNLGERCWIYVFPRGQWRGGHECSAMRNELVLKEFSDWQKRPQIKTRAEIRREFFRSRAPKDSHKIRGRSRW